MSTVSKPTSPRDPDKHPAAAAAHAAWEPPSERVRELIRRGAEMVLDTPARWTDEIEQVTLGSAAMKPVANDPVLAASMRRSLLSNLIHWAAANIRDPGAPVPANVGSEALRIARDLTRRGLGEAALHTYRTGQNAAWSRWMSIAFELTADPQELREFLEVSARSIASFIDATVTGIEAQMASEREELTRGTHAERREVVSLIVQGSPITASRATQRLGYALEQPHRAAVIWSEEENFQLSALEAAADVLAQSLGVPHAFSVVASAATLWVWVPSAAEVDLGRLRAAAQALEGVRIALGTVGRGLEGFRRSHLDALSTQRMLARLSAGPRVASFDMVRLVTLFTDDPERAEEFVHHTLGRLAAAPAELRDALRVFLEEGCSAARTAARLHTHRNTLLRRLARAEDLLPRPLDQHRLQVGVALEILRWERAGA